VNAFVVENVARVISVQDMPITENGTVIGLIRTLVYET